MLGHKKLGRNKILAVMVTVLLILGGGYGMVSFEAEAAGSKTVEIRLVSTTDLHGQLTTNNYETGGGSYNIGSLAKAYTLIQNARAERGAENTFTFDVGDVLYDYTTEHIWETNPEEIQPIYQAMASVGYDAITLGNHDFDYGFSYIKKQIKGAGLSDVCVVSNVKDANTGKSIWKQNKLITRKAKATDGSEVSIQIGIIGETIPVLSKKNEDYTAVLKTEDIVSNVKAQAKALRNKGADVIVVLAHSGFGSETPKLLDRNVSYALTKIKEVDVVFCGHEHHNFPSDEVGSANYYNAKGVDRETGLVNGKNLVMSSDRGKSIGVVDLTLKATDKSTAIVNRASGIMRVDSATTEANAAVNNNYIGNWKAVFEAAINNVIGEIEEGKRIYNYFGLLEDSAAIQLMNNAKLKYALNYVHKNLIEYKDYPIISASKYRAYGYEDSYDYIDLSGDMKEVNLSRLQSYNTYVNLYTITGAQLKEWLEWSASAYTGTAIEAPVLPATESAVATAPLVTAIPSVISEGAVTGSVMTQSVATVAAVSAPAITGAAIIEEKGLQNILQEEWQYNWSSFYVFDGVEYEIDTSVAPRYDITGKKINETSRITRLTWNGTEVDENKKFVLACEKIHTTTEATKGLDEQRIYGGYNRSQTILVDYVQELNRTGKISAAADNNWHVNIPEGPEYVVIGGNQSEAIAKTKSWYRATLKLEDEYQYYLAQFAPNREDTTGPNIIYTVTTTVTTNHDVPVILQTNDTSGVVALKYAYGKYGQEDVTAWNNASLITGNTFAAAENGTYTIFAEDSLGNRSAAQVYINNINRSVLQAPSVVTYTNRKKQITGRAEPHAKIYFEVGENVYSSTVAADGTFAYPLPSQRAGTQVSVYVEDGQGRFSDRTVITVKRTGPNCPMIDTISNNTVKIKGSVNDTYVTPFVVIGKTVYVEKEGGKEAFQSSDIYHKKYTIKTTTVTIAEDGSLAMTIPAQREETQIKIYTADSAGRVSRLVTKTVEEAAPNKPTIFSVCDIERQVSGYVYFKEDNKTANITVLANGKEYKGVTEAGGYFTVKTGDLKLGQTVKVYAEDTGAAGEVRKSATASTTVKNVNSYIKTDSPCLSIDERTNKETKITGNCSYRQEVVYVRIRNQLYSLKTGSDGDFKLNLKEPLKTGTVVYGLYRYENGNIYQATKMVIEKGIPNKPKLTTQSITNATTKVKVQSEESCKVVVTVGKKTYSAKAHSYNSKTKTYSYSVKIPKTNGGTPIKVYAENSVGSSKKNYLKVKEVAPNAPKIKTVREGAKKIKGKVHLKAAEKVDKPTVRNTSTKVYAKIKGKVYTGKIKNDGSFTINIAKAKVKKGRSITLFASNKAGGKGPVIQVRVKK